MNTNDIDVDFIVEGEKLKGMSIFSDKPEVIDNFRCILYQISSAYSAKGDKNPFRLEKLINAVKESNV